MIRHTPEPWTYDEDNDLMLGPDGVSLRAGSAIKDPDEVSANGRRMVACVNACAGMTDPAAEIAAMRNRLEDLDVRLTAIFMHANELERATLSVDQRQIVCEIVEILKPALTKSGGGGAA